MITYRQIVEADIPALFAIRLATWGNDRAAEEMAALGIQHDSVLARLRSNHAGWIAFVDGKPVGFTIADRGNGELWVIAVLPECEGRGIGRELMRQAEAWLFSHGWEEIWLTTSANENVRAVGFYRHLGWVDWKLEGARYLKKANPRSVIRLEEHKVVGIDTGYTRIVRLQRGPEDTPHRLCLFLDGEHYWRDMDAVPVLNALSGGGGGPQMTFAFVGHVSGAARHEDYTCNDRYGRFIGEEVMSWLKKEVPMLQSGGHLIVGLSLSGLTAAFLALKYPRHFGGCLSQSGSYWWNHEWFVTMARQREPLQGRFWLSVGDQETTSGVTHPPSGLLQEISQISGVEKASRVLKEIGGTVRCHKYHGGHSLQCWRNELDEALRWLLMNVPSNMTMPTTSMWTPAGVDDFPRAIALMREFYAEEKMDYDENRASRCLRELVSNPALGVVLLLRDGPYVHGYLASSFGFTLEFGGRFVLLDELYICPPWRGRGAGKQALIAIEKWAMNHGAATVRLEVNHHNEKARSIYMKSGYMDDNRGILTKWIERGE